MKYLKYNVVLLLGILLIACSEDDKLTVEIQDSVERGAVLRTISNDPNSFTFDDPDSEWTLSMEEQDIEDGALLSSVDVLVGYVDLTGNGVSATETALMNIPASAFSEGINGLPRTTFTITYDEALTALGLPFDPSYAGDAINIRLILNLTDGRSITNTDLTGPVSGGSFFASPLNYRSNIVCPAKAGTVGTWTVDMQDSFGDGWNGALLDVTIDDETTSYEVSEAQGTVNTETFEITPDNQSLSIIFRSGDFDGEITFQVINPNNDVILDLGPTPTADVELLDYCSDF